jgi:hypothetical protein
MLFDLFTSVFVGGFLGFFIAMTIDAILNSNKTWSRELRNMVMFVSLLGTIIFSFIWLTVN